MSMSDKNRMFVAQSNDNEYLYQDQSGNLGRILFRYYTQKDAQSAIERAGRTNQCHVVELVEAPAKVVLTKEQAEIVEEARVSDIPAAYISVNTDCDGEESLLMNAYVNGYTVAKETLYNVKVPHSTDGYYWRGISGQVHTYTEPDQHARVLKTDAYIWTQKQIDDAELQDCDKEEATDDEV